MKSQENKRNLSVPTGKEFGNADFSLVVNAGHSPGSYPKLSQAFRVTENWWEPRSPWGELEQ